jgi:hypothetical protein
MANCQCSTTARDTRSGVSATQRIESNTARAPARRTRSLRKDSSLCEPRRSLRSAGVFPDQSLHIRVPGLENSSNPCHTTRLGRGTGRASTISCAISGKTSGSPRSRWNPFSDFSGKGWKRERDRSYRKSIESVQGKALRALRAAAARAQSYSHPSHRSRQSDRRTRPFVWRQSLRPLVLSGRAKHPYRPRCS